MSRKSGRTTAPPDPLEIIPLGGLGEIGMNLMVYGCQGKLLVVDCGLTFPNPDTPGVDVIIPDSRFLTENRDRVVGFVLTHGHEDHIGAMPYIWPDVEGPIYGTAMTLGLLKGKFKEHQLLGRAELIEVDYRRAFQVGPFSLRFIHVTHSIVDAAALAITTSLGTIVHTGDFKIDHTPVDGHTTDFAKLAELGADGVLLLCSDSTYAEVEGYTVSEEVVRGAIDRVVADAQARIIFATFASLISRVQMVIDAAVKNRRKVAVVGRSMRNNVGMALEMGYLNAPGGTVIPLKEAKRLPHDRVVILATGAQGEPTSALVRMSRGDHQDVEIETGDTVVISSSPIPGNETLVARTIDNLYRRGAEVISSRNALVHVHGHAAREELKLVLNLVRPTYFVPVHGEHRHLVAHTRLAQSLGMHHEDTFVLEDGDVLEIESDWAGVVDRVPVEDVYIAGHRLWGQHSSVLEERNRLSIDGVVAVGLTLDAETGAPLKPPSLESRGFDELSRAQELLETASQVVLSALENDSGKVLDFDQIKKKVTASVSDLLYKETRRRPTVLTLVEKVERR